MFWCIAPFLVATLVLLPLLARPPEPTGWIVVVGVEIMCLCTFLGLSNPDRFKWCWRTVGAVACIGYLAYLISMIVKGQWFGEGRRALPTVVNAFGGLVAFGYPGFMYAAFGRFTWHAEPKVDDDFETTTVNVADKFVDPA